ncbi:MAG TPA: Crp/Fnr family transcriptional regulator [Gaiellaceae bacterium]|nr:Crp/Fnr family transcriptional regulator [Gaiellaceae bacterium]
MEWRLFEGIPSGDVRAVVALARRRRFARGEVVFHRGDPADTVHLVVKGRFDVRVTTRFGDVVALGICGPGDAFGELALVTGGRRSATVSALEPAETLSLRRDALERLTRELPSVNVALVRLLAQQVERLSQLLVEAHTVDADARVARRLLELASVYGSAASAAEVPLTQEAIAGLAGTSRATVNRVLRGLERDGAVRLRRGRTVVADVEALERLAGRERDARG